MIDDIYVIDDFLPQKLADQIETMFLGRDMNWKLIMDVTYPFDITKNESNKKQIPACSSTYYDDRFGGPIEPVLFFATIPIVHMGLQKINYKEDYKPFRMRSFLQFPIKRDNPEEYNNIHVDDNRPHIAFLYYVNDSDGDTVLFNQTTDDFPYDGDVPSSSFMKLLNDNATIYKRVTPKKGRAVIFNGKRYHASSTPSTNIRCIINADLTDA